MAIYRLLRNSIFDSRQTAIMTAAYERALVDLGIEDRSDYRTEIIAFAILHRVRQGDMNEARLIEAARQALERIAVTSAADPVSVGALSSLDESCRD